MKGEKFKIVFFVKPGALEFSTDSKTNLAILLAKLCFPRTIISVLENMRGVSEARAPSWKFGYNQTIGLYFFGCNLIFQ